jgi:hypothetical protein
MRIYDLKDEEDATLAQMKRYIVVVTDIPYEYHNYRHKKLSVRSCAGHIATKVTEKFNIPHNRMLWVEYYPPATYGEDKEKEIPERFDTAEFKWEDGKAFTPIFSPIKEPLLDMVKERMSDVKLVIRDPEKMGKILRFKFQK